MSSYSLLTVVIVAILAYIVGARYPAAAKRVGLAA